MFVGNYIICENMIVISSNKCLVNQMNLYLFLLLLCIKNSIALNHHKAIWIRNQIVSLGVTYSETHYSQMTFSSCLYFILFNW